MLRVSPVDWRDGNLAPCKQRRRAMQPRLQSLFCLQVTSGKVVGFVSFLLLRLMCLPILSIQGKLLEGAATISFLECRTESLARGTGRLFEAATRHSTRPFVAWGRSCLGVSLGLCDAVRCTSHLSPLMLAPQLARPAVTIGATWEAQLRPGPLLSTHRHAWLHFVTRARRFFLF